MFRRLNQFMSGCACKLVKTIRVYMIWCILFLFAMNAVVEKLSFLFLMPVKDNDYFASVWLTLLTRSFSIYLFYLYLRAKDDSSIFSKSVWWGSLYSMFAAKYEETKCIPNPFLQSNCNDSYYFIQACVTNRVPLFDHVSPIEVSWVW